MTVNKRATPTGDQQPTNAGSLPRVVYAADCSPQDAREILDAHRTALANGGDAVLKDGPRTAVTRIDRHGQLLCVKEYRLKGWRDRVKDTLRGRRARRAWRAIARLAACGIPTPEPIAVLERAGTSFLVTRFVENARPLKELLRERFARALSPDELAAKRAMIRQLGQWLRRVHDCGVYHDDWSAKNILVTDGAGAWDFHLLDLESVVPYKPLTYRRRVKNLGQVSDAPFGVSRTDRMRFLLAYAAGDRTLTRGRFPRDILAAGRRRARAWARVQARARKRKAKARRAAEKRDSAQ